jgi:hypothetical protein
MDTIAEKLTASTPIGKAKSSSELLPNSRQQYYQQKQQKSSVCDLNSKLNSLSAPVLSEPSRPPKPPSSSLNDRFFYRNNGTGSTSTAKKPSSQIANSVTTLIESTRASIADPSTSMTSNGIPQYPSLGYLKEKLHSTNAMKKLYSQDSLRTSKTSSSYAPSIDDLSDSISSYNGRDTDSDLLTTRATGEPSIYLDSASMFSVPRSSLATAADPRPKSYSKSANDNASKSTKTLAAGATSKKTKPRGKFISTTITGKSGAKSQRQSTRTRESSSTSAAPSTTRSTSFFDMLDSFKHHPHRSSVSTDSRSSVVSSSVSSNRPLYNKDSAPFPTSNRGTAYQHSVPKYPTSSSSYYFSKCSGAGVEARERSDSSSAYPYDRRQTSSRKEVVVSSKFLDILHNQLEDLSVTTKQQRVQITTLESELSGYQQKLFSLKSKLQHEQKLHIEEVERLKSQMKSLEIRMEERVLALKKHYKAKIRTLEFELYKTKLHAQKTEERLSNTAAALKAEKDLISRKAMEEKEKTVMTLVKDLKVLDNIVNKQEELAMQKTKLARLERLERERTNMTKTFLKDLMTKVQIATSA